MYYEMLFKGTGIGFLVAAMIGPIAVLCIRNTLAYGQLTGLAIGFGTTLADLIFGLIAAFGISFVADCLVAHTSLLRVIAGVFLLYLGIKTFIEIPKDVAPELHSKKIFSTIGSTFFLTITNPVTILTFTAIFAGFGIDTEATNNLAVFILLIGIFVGSMAWYCILTSFLRLFHNRMNHKTLILVNKCAGGILAGFGVLTITSLLIK